MPTLPRPQPNDDDRTYWEWVARVQQQWMPEEWEAMRSKLATLTLEELCAVTTEVGIQFAVGNENITDPQDFILVLDEADKNRLQGAVDAVLRKRAA